ncbi:MAG: aldo/keto reductase, partial [Atopobiaceae bacterium]|nr:aldo/keto reductase [Atopobiaceae bacterium]
FYLLHNINEKSFDKYNAYNLWPFMNELKASGKIKKLGFSFHGKPDLLRRIFTEHPEVDFCQLQVNYADMNEPAVQAAGNIAVCNEFGVPFTIMEPVKGGTLANPPAAVAAVFDEANPDVSNPSWAIRFAASQPGCLTTLSGMSSIAQMEDNLATMKDFEPMGPEDLAIMDRARTIIEGIDSIKCTACEYCTPGCPMSIPIPEYFKAMNSILIYGDQAAGENRFKRISSNPANGLPSACIQCGQCEGACPQSLPIISYLERVAATFE